MANFSLKENVSALIKNHPTPFYLYDIDGIRRRARSLKGAFGNQAEIFYAMKANSFLPLLGVLNQEGLGVDLVSGGELECALKAGFEPSKMVFSGVGKTVEEISKALDTGVGQINVESLPELERIGSIARSKRKMAQIALRLNPDVDAKTHPYISTGLKNNKFGIDLTQLDTAKNIIKSFSDSVNWCGVSLHLGSQMLDLSPLEEGIDIIVHLVGELRREGFQLKVLDVGGGIGIPYRPNEPAPNEIEYAQRVLNKTKNLGLRIQLEPGRWLVGPFGWLVARVEYVKRTPHKNFIVLNTGMHHLLRPALYQSYHEIFPLETRVGKGEVFDVVGPICESTDCLGLGRTFSAPLEGDIFIIKDAGAYGAVMANNYNRRGLPMELGVDGDCVLVEV